MVRYASSITVPFPRERVWALMSDWRNLATWDVNVTKSVLAAGQAENARGVGTKYDCLFRSSPEQKEMKVDYTCTLYNEPSECKYEGLAGLFRSNDAIECEAVDDHSTKVTAEFNLVFRGILSPFSFVMNGVMQKTGPIVMKDMDEFIKKELGEK